MIKRRFQPGFRLSQMDILVLVVGAGASAYAYSVDRWIGILIAFVFLHFFVFCNVVRMSRQLELTWAGAFAGLAAIAAVSNALSWPTVLAASSLVTVMLAVIEVRRPSYHGVGWQFANPQLPEWWECKVLGRKTPADRAVQVNALPPMGASSATFPTVRAIGDSLVVAYHLADGDGTSAVIRFNGVMDWTYGYPNDEGLPEHPLYAKGLRYYTFHQVLPADGELVQWVATFHCGTLTVRGKSVDVLDEQIAGEPWTAIDARFGQGPNTVLGMR